MNSVEVKRWKETFMGKSSMQIVQVGDLKFCATPGRAYYAKTNLYGIIVATGFVTRDEFGNWITLTTVQILRDISKDNDRVIELKRFNEAIADADTPFLWAHEKIQELTSNKIQ